ncbi:MAG: peptidylprolyl isomerase [Pseudomonadota bacterium]
MQIDNLKVVTLDYTLKDDAGTVLDSTEGRGDFAYLHGARNIIPGLENALNGKSVGDSLQVHITPADAYGEKNEELVHTVPRDMFETDTEIQVGMQFHAQSTSGQMMVVTVVEVSADEITVDGNHPLAGVPLNFDVKVVDVRDATAEEIAHGHVHAGGCGHQH